MCRSPVPLDTTLAELSAFYADHLVDTTHPLPGVDSGLRALHAAGFPLALVTNKPAPHARRLLAHFGWTTLFSATVGGDTPERKPSPVPLLRALEILGKSPSSAWMIGDHHTDLAAAHLASIPAPHDAFRDFVHRPRLPKRPRPELLVAIHRLQLQPSQLHPVRRHDQVTPRKQLRRPHLPLPVQPPEHPPRQLPQIIAPFDIQHRSVLCFLLRPDYICLLLTPSNAFCRRTSGHFSDTIVPCIVDGILCRSEEIFFGILQLQSKFLECRH